MTKQFSTDAGVAAWIRDQVAQLSDAESYAPGPDGDADLIEDFMLTIQMFNRERERAALARIRETRAADVDESRQHAVPERDVSLPWLSGE
jgi:hypothetical protein